MKRSEIISELNKVIEPWLDDCDATILSQDVLTRLEELRILPPYRPGWAVLDENGEEKEGRVYAWDYETEDKPK